MCLWANATHLPLCRNLLDCVRLQGHACSSDGCDCHLGRHLHPDQLQRSRCVVTSCSRAAPPSPAAERRWWSSHSLSRASRHVAARSTDPDACHAHPIPAAFATGYKVHVLDSNGAAVQSGGTDVISTLNGISGSGSHSYSLQLVELGSPSGAATFRFKVRQPHILVGWHEGMPAVDCAGCPRHWPGQRVVCRASCIVSRVLTAT